MSSSFKLADVTVLYQPHNLSKPSDIRPGTVRVAHIDDLALRQRFEMDCPIATFMCRSNDSQAQLAALMLVFRFLTVEHGADPKVVDAEFTKIEEYADVLRGY